MFDIGAVIDYYYIRVVNTILITNILEKFSIYIFYNHR